MTNERKNDNKCNTRRRRVLLVHTMIVVFFSLVRTVRKTARARENKRSYLSRNVQRDRTDGRTAPTQTGVCGRKQFCTLGPYTAE